MIPLATSPSTRPSPSPALTIISPGRSSPTGTTGTTPSTAKSSVFSSADSLLSTTPPSPNYISAKSGLPSKPKRRRNHGQETDSPDAAPKRRRVMGRPKNGWTPTRLRKLTRLYLMTRLEVYEIAKVLQEDGFTPKQRDVNTQLALILQPRPNKIRLGAHIAKTRLNVIRECRNLRRNRRAPHPGDTHKVPTVTKNSGFIDPAKLSVNLTDVGIPPSQVKPNSEPHVEWELPVPFVQAPENIEWPLCGFNFELHPENVSTSPSPRPSSLPAQLIHESSPEPASNGYEAVYLGEQNRMQTSSFRLFNTSSTSLIGHNTLPQIAEEPSLDIDGSPSHQQWSLPEKAIRSTHLNVPSLRSGPTPPASIPSSIRRPEYPSSTENFPEPIPSDFYPDPELSSTEPIFTSEDLPLNKKRASRNEQKRNSSLFDKRESPRASHIGIAVLNETLLFKYSNSSLEDISSLLDRFTISESPRSFISKSSWRSSKLSSYSEISISQQSRGLSMLSTHPVLSSKPISPPVTLPGTFHSFCWSDIVERSVLGYCRFDGSLCEHKCPTQKFFISEELSHSIPVKKGTVFRRIISPNMKKVDMFGNSILHVAGSLCSPVNYLIELITKGADIKAVNSAGQTFLHLVHAPEEGKDLCELLGMLSIRGFNFGHHDHHGQTSLHHLTRPWLPRPYLITVIRKLHTLGFVLPTTRDNLGFTLLDQMKYLGYQVLGFDPDEDLGYRRSLGLTCETKGYIVGSQYPKVPTNPLPVRPCLQNYENGHPIETLEDLQGYAYHADLLRTIMQAGEVPWFEDSRGRNGLHCLAEVDLIPPIPENPPMDADSSRGSTNVESLRERTLDSLLAAGVHPNNYDNEGSTPLMAFIVHSHAGEDDDVTTRILTKLVSAGADVNRRNRKGQTALHLAVKMGRRAATKFLLNHGANIHARAKGRLGVVQLGWNALERQPDSNLYAQILLCISLAVSAGAESSPTILQEWSL